MKMPWVENQQMFKHELQREACKDRCSMGGVSLLLPWTTLCNGLYAFSDGQWFSQAAQGGEDSWLLLVFVCLFVLRRHFQCKWQCWLCWLCSRMFCFVRPHHQIMSASPSPPPPYPFSCLASTGTNANSYNAWPPFVLKAHGVNHIPLVSELDIKSYTGYPPGNEIRVSPPIGATCQKLRTEGPDSGGSLLFMTTAWQHHESVMRTPPWRRDQAQSPEIAMKYSIVFTHRNLFPRKRTKQQGCERCGS